MEEKTVNLFLFFKKREDVKIPQYTQVWQGRIKCNLRFETELFLEWSLEKSTWSDVTYWSRSNSLFIAKKYLSIWTKMTICTQVVREYTLCSVEKKR